MDDTPIPDASPVVTPDATPAVDAAPAVPTVTPDQAMQLAGLQSARDGAASADARAFVQSQIDALLASINQ